MFAVDESSCKGLARSQAMTSLNQCSLSPYLVSFPRYHQLLSKILNVRLAYQTVEVFTTAKAIWQYGASDPKSPLPWANRSLYTMSLGTTRVSLSNGTPFRPTALAGCTSVTDDIHTDGQTGRRRYDNMCRNRRNRFRRRRLRCFNFFWVLRLSDPLTLKSV